MNTPEPPHVMQESYWRFGDSDTHFMIREFTVRVKQKLNFRRFPFDRQAINVVIESNNCQAVPYPDVREGCGSKMADIEPISFKGVPDVEMALDAAAYLWTLEFAQVKANTDAEGLTKVHTHARLERRASYYEWNIGFIMYMIVLAAFVGCAIPLDSVADRFALDSTLILTTVAFKFVTSEMTPKTPYMTRMDQFMLTGVLVLMLVLVKDFVMAMLAKEMEEQEDIDTKNHTFWFNTEEVDNAFSLALATAWTLFVILIVLGGRFDFPFLRPGWKEVIRKSEVEVESWTQDNLMSGALTRSCANGKKVEEAEHGHGHGHGK
jgi:hypothetical protein